MISQKTGKAKLTARSDPAVILAQAGCRLTQNPQQITQWINRHYDLHTAQYIRSKPQTKIFPLPWTSAQISIHKTFKAVWIILKNDFFSKPVENYWIGRSLRWVYKQGRENTDAPLCYAINSISHPFYDEKTNCFLRKRNSLFKYNSYKLHASENWHLSQFRISGIKRDTTCTSIGDNRANDRSSRLHSVMWAEVVRNTKNYCGTVQRE